MCDDPLREPVRRNRERIPSDFMFQLTAEKPAFLRSQIATLEAGRGQHRKYLPYAVNEQGAIMNRIASHAGNASSSRCLRRTMLVRCEPVSFYAKSPVMDDYVTGLFCLY